MPTTDCDRAHQVLGPAECLELLETADIGRLAYTEAALPAIRPVTFSLSGGEVLVAAPRSSPLVTALRRSVVAFEADCYDPGTRTGWAVTVIGPSRVVEGPPADSGVSDSCVIAVQVGLVQGWRTSFPR